MPNSSMFKAFQWSSLAFQKVGGNKTAEFDFNVKLNYKYKTVARFVDWGNILPRFCLVEEDGLKRTSRSI